MKDVRSDFTFSNEPYRYHPLKPDEIMWARELHNDRDILKMLTDSHEVSKEEQERWYPTIKDSSSSSKIVTEESENRIGLIRIDRYDRENKSICLGLDIQKEHRGKGHASKIYAQILDRSFKELGINRVWLLVASFNKRAIHIYEKIGMKHEGVQREALYRPEFTSATGYHDYLMMSILRSEWK